MARVYVRPSKTVSACGPWVGVAERIAIIAYMGGYEDKLRFCFASWLCVERTGCHTPRGLCKAVGARGLSCVVSATPPGTTNREQCVS